MINDKGYWIPDAVTADILPVAINGSGNIVGLFIERNNKSGVEPGKIAIPGGHMDEDDEDLEATAVRELKEETGIEVTKDQLKFIGPFSRKDRDPRGRYIDMAYFVKVPIEVMQNAIAGDDAGKVIILGLVPALEKDLAFDHKEIVQRLVKRMGL